MISSYVDTLLCRFFSRKRDGHSGDRSTKTKAKTPDPDRMRLPSLTPQSRHLNLSSTMLARTPTIKPQQVIFMWNS